MRGRKGEEEEEMEGKRVSLFDVEGEASAPLFLLPISLALSSNRSSFALLDSTTVISSTEELRLEEEAAKLSKTAGSAPRSRTRRNLEESRGEQSSSLSTSLDATSRTRGSSSPCFPSCLRSHAARSRWARLRSLEEKEREWGRRG